MDVRDEARFGALSLIVAQALAGIASLDRSPVGWLNDVEKMATHAIDSGVTASPTVLHEVQQAMRLQLAATMRLARQAAHVPENGSSGPGATPTA